MSEITFKCEVCGAELDAVIAVKNPSGITVVPCTDRLAEAESNGHSDGYDEGYAEGEAAGQQKDSPAEEEPSK